MVSSVAGKRFDYCIDFTRNDRSAFLTLLSGARRRVASYRVREQSKTRARVYTDLVGVRVRDMHTIDYNLALLEPLGVRAASSAPQLELPRTAREKADRLRRDWKIDATLRDFASRLGPRRKTAGDAARWAEVIDHFCQDNELDFILTSGPAAHEQTHIAAIKHRTRQKFIDLSGKTDLLALAAFVAQAQLLVTVDSAQMHFAAASHTPQVIFFGPTNPFIGDQRTIQH